VVVVFAVYKLSPSFYFYIWKTEFDEWEVFRLDSAKYDESSANSSWR